MSVENQAPEQNLDSFSVFATFIHAEGECSLFFQTLSWMWEHRLSLPVTGKKQNLIYNFSDYTGLKKTSCTKAFLYWIFGGMPVSIRTSTQRIYMENISNHIISFASYPKELYSFRKNKQLPVVTVPCLHILESLRVAVYFYCIRIYLVLRDVWKVTFPQQTNSSQTNAAFSCLEHKNICRWCHASIGCK